MVAAPEPRVREYGESGPSVVLVHGGPGAPGSMAPVARGLADSFRVLEPFQRGSGSGRLTVARHVTDLHDLISERFGSDPPAVVGHSWGAMLALAHAAAHPAEVASVVLVGCGTFDAVSRERLQRNRERRMDARLRHRLARLATEISDPDERLRATGALLLPVDSHDLASDQTEVDHVDALAFRESWDDMIRLQESGRYPAAFAAIQAPVLMLHGAEDPHPGPLIRASLEPHIARLEYREPAECGHYPWLEKAARDEFFSVLRDWLADRRR